MGIVTWWGVHGSIWAWPCDNLCGWCHSAIFPSLFHVFSRLPREVHYLFISAYIFLIFFFRVVISTIRKQGKCPSPRTFIEEKYISALGSMADDQRRQHIRLDNDHRQENVKLARKFIFEKGLGIRSKGVEGLLGSTSYTPTRVCIFVSYSYFFSINKCPLRVPSPFGSPISSSISFLCSFQIYCMNLN